MRKIYKNDSKEVQSSNGEIIQTNVFACKLDTYKSMLKISEFRRKVKLFLKIVAMSA